MTIIQKATIMAKSNSYTPNLGEPVTKFVKPNRAVDVVFLHCTATSNPSFDAKACHDLHVDQNGWSAIGYTYLITTQGEIQYGRDLEQTPAAQSGYNTGSIAISLNGLEVEDFNQAQLDALRWLCGEIEAAYGGMRYRGHCEVAAKSCPVFDYHKELGLNADGYMTGAYEPGEPPKATIPMVPITVNLAQLGEGDVHPHVVYVRNILGRPGGEEFGPNLHTAVVAFQQANNLTADGIVGQSTWGRLLDVGT